MQWVARQKFHRRSAPMQGWGVALLPVACALWVWPAFLPADRSDAYGYRTVSNRRPLTARPERLTIPAVSAPVSVFGAALLVGGSVRRQTGAHILQVIETQKSEERARGKQPPPRARPGAPPCARPRPPPRPPRTRADRAR